ncbi:MAG: hypothetical protein ACRDP7_15390 [Trebonia sp.]
MTPRGLAGRPYRGQVGNPGRVAYAVFAGHGMIVGVGPGEGTDAVAGRDVRDPQRFWLAVLDALRGTGPGSALVQTLTAAPDLDGWALVERLLADLAPVSGPL